ncbi:UDP-N-acetylmuramate--L-alanine ligase [subsurface metagenome]
MNNILKAFRKYISHLPKDGILITDKSTDKKEVKKLRKILKVPGEHNVSNASIALMAARSLKIPDKVSYQALSSYQGTWRRFEIRKKDQLTIVSDYGHHPTEVKATLKAAREKWPEKEIWCVFQPHQYQRTYYLFNDFVKVFSRTPINKIIITDIYDVAGRENKNLKKKVNSEKLVKAVKNPKVIYLAKKKIISYLKNNLQGREVIIIMGAGDIYEIDKALK